MRKPLGGCLVRNVVLTIPVPDGAWLSDESEFMGSEDWRENMTAYY